MEIKEIMKKIRKNKVLLGLSCFLGLLAGFIFFILPPIYTASGSLYVTRKAEDSGSFFTYEGYYSQQSAITYTNSVVALAESSDVKEQVLKSMGMPLDTINLRKLNNSIIVKKTGPQIINIDVRNKNSDKSKRIWEELSKSIIETSKNINENSNDNLSVVKVSDKPLIRENYKPPLIIGLSGLLLGFSIGLLVISLKEYFRD